jgi:hypothetical protein
METRLLLSPALRGVLDLVVLILGLAIPFTFHAGQSIKLVNPFTVSFLLGTISITCKWQQMTFI